MSREVRTYVIPVSPGQWCTVDGPFPLNGLEWERFLKVLDAMKPGLMVASLPAPADAAPIRGAAS